MMKYDGSCPFIATGKLYKDISPKYICGINSLGKFEKSSGGEGWTTEFYIPASEKAKKELSNKMTQAGYKWNANTLELEKIESQFKEGDVVVDKDSNLCLVSKVEDSTTIIVSAVLYTNGTIGIYDGVSRLNKEITLASIKERNIFYSTLTKEAFTKDDIMDAFMKGCSVAQQHLSEKYGYIIHTVSDETKRNREIMKDVKEILSSINSI